MAIENFTTYTEVDAQGFLTVTTNKATGLNVHGDVTDHDCILYKSFGVDHFNALDVDFEIYVENQGGDARYGMAGMAISNTVDDFRGGASTDIAVLGQPRGSNVAWVRLFRGNSVADDTFIGAVVTPYYCTMTRAAGNDSVTVDVYDDSGRTNLVDTLVVAGYSTTKYRYAFGFTNNNDGTTPLRLFNGYIQNLDLKETTEQAVGGGTVTPVGTLGIKVFKAVGGGTVTPVGVLSSIPKFSKSVGSGTVTPVGVLGLKVLRSVGSGTITPVGALGLKVLRAVGSGTITPVGTLASKLCVNVGGGIVAMAGALGVLVKKAVGGGTITPTGALEAEYTLGIQVNGSVVRILKGSLSVDRRIEERSTAEFTIIDLEASLSFLQGHLVDIYDPDNAKIFGGVIADPEAIRAAPSGELLHPIRCIDNHYFADKRLVAESYESKTCGFIVDDIFDKYLVDEGVTIGNIDLGATLIEAIFNYVRVTDCYDALAEKAGFIWYIDENKALYFQARDTTAAPWTATGDDMEKGTTRLSAAKPLYRNRQYIRGGRGTTLEQTEVFIADGEQFAFTVGFPFERVPTSVNVEDDGAQTIGIKGLDAPGDFDCYWNKGDATLTFSTAPIAGKEVTIVYYGQFPILTLAEDLPQIAAQAAIEGIGTGIVDDIADEPTLNDKDASFDSGVAKLNKYAVDTKRLYYSTKRSGLSPGQLQPVNYPALGLDEDMLIESITTRVFAGVATHDITAIRGPEMGSWARLFSSLAAMKAEVIERLNVGSEQVLIILVTSKETWGWEESYTVTPAACTFPSATTYPSTTLYPC